MRTLRTLVAALLGAALLPSVSPGAGLRNPQVVVAGSALQDFLTSQGDQIDVNHDQMSDQVLRSFVSAQSPLMYAFELGRVAPGQTLGLYDGASSAPALIPVFLAGSAGSYAVVAFRVNPDRVIVNVVDANASIIRTTTTPGGNRNAIGLYMDGPQGVFFTEDSRNPNGAPQVLFYRGTGLDAGNFWLCFEDELPGPGANRDFIAAVVFIEPLDGLPVRSTSWGRLKARFR